LTDSPVLFDSGDEFGSRGSDTHSSESESSHRGLVTAAMSAPKIGQELFEASFVIEAGQIGDEWAGSLEWGGVGGGVVHGDK